jgi:hypothetical protein
MILHILFAIYEFWEFKYRLASTGMRRITFRSTDRIYDGGPIRLYYNIIIMTTVATAYSIQCSNMLCRFVA